MSARLKIDVLLKETIKLNLLRLVERLEHQHVWARLQHSETHQFIFYLCRTQIEVGSSGLNVCSQDKNPGCCMKSP